MAGGAQIVHMAGGAESISRKLQMERAVSVPRFPPSVQGHKIVTLGSVLAQFSHLYIFTSLQSSRPSINANTVWSTILVSSYVGIHITAAIVVWM